MASSDISTNVSIPIPQYHVQKDLATSYLTEEVSVEIQTGNGTWDATESELTLQFKSDKVFINLRKQDFLSAVYYSREVAKQRD